MSRAPESLADHLDEISAAMGVVAMLNAEGELTHRDMRAAVTCVEKSLSAIGLITGAPRLQVLPLLTLGEVAARARYRAEGQRPQLRAIDGGRA